MTSYMYEKLFYATLDTIYLTFISTFFVAIFGIMLGVILYCTSKNEFLENKYIYFILGGFVNIIRSIPFIILIILLLPITKFLMGTIIGTNAAFPALIIGVAPFYAKMVETSFKAIDKGIIEAIKAHGATNLQIIFKVLLPESAPLLISNLTTMMVSILSYTAMAGVIGSGGLGNLAFIDGFQRNNQLITFLSTLIILILVFIIQYTGDFIVKRIDKK